MTSVLYLMSHVETSGKSVLQIEVWTLGWARHDFIDLVKFYPGTRNRTLSGHVNAWLASCIHTSEIYSFVIWSWQLINSSLAEHVLQIVFVHSVKKYVFIYDNVNHLFLPIFYIIIILRVSNHGLRGVQLFMNTCVRWFFINRLIQTPSHKVLQQDTGGWGCFSQHRLLLFGEPCTHILEKLTLSGRVNIYFTLKGNQGGRMDWRWSMWCANSLAWSKRPAQNRGQTCPNCWIGGAFRN